MQKDRNLSIDLIKIIAMFGVMQPDSQVIDKLCKGLVLFTARVA